MGEATRKFVAYLKQQAWAAAEVADMIERGDLEEAKRHYWMLDLDTGLYHYQMMAEGQQELNHEHVEAVERRTA